MKKDWAGTWFKIAAFGMMSGVLLGAFGAHALKGRLPVERLEAYHTAVLYQFMHALGLFVVALAPSAPWRKRPADFSGVCFSAGIVLFSGSLYLLALTGIRWIGAFTPVGGFLFIAGWLVLALG